jgi:hypothetical protein
MPDVAIDGDGRVYAAWDRSRVFDASERQVEAARRTSAGWTAATLVSDGAEQAEHPQIVADRNGNATVAYLRRGGTGDDPTYRLRAARRANGGSWGDPVTLTGTSVDDFEMDADSGGTVAIGLRRVTDTNVIVEAIRRPAGGSWGEPRRISRPGLPAFDLDIDASGGEILLAFVQVVEETNYRSRILAARWTEGSWRAPDTVTDRYDGLYGLELDFNSDGRAVLGRMRRDGTWTDEVRLSSLERQSSLGDIVLRQSGNAFAIWHSIRADYTGYMLVQFSQDS